MLSATIIIFLLTVLVALDDVDLRDPDDLGLKRVPITPTVMQSPSALRRL